ncbi:SDR family oxidoreductase [Roseibacterium sp. SDUM158017]|uniref:SDR family oxidoreductase n=1 Tax=Roseicyclus salinarum TaxID=3036773 RepID=UPI00241550CB|nr:SDR family oxidoreductase [Roseibacterium sp. SDUM158017]MDG4650503.1 SDR family oxidoreductase [Roseibacterium sp. SDUM158017]
MGHSRRRRRRGRKRRRRPRRGRGADRVMTIPCDVSCAREVSRAGAAIAEGLGPIGVWVNCAMLTSFSPFPQMAPQEFEKIIDTTFLGVVNGTRTALSLMRRHGRGRIVTVGSGLGYRSVPFQSAYCASKHAINGFLASVRSELIREGADITLGVVQLPAIDTPQFGWARNRLEEMPQPAPPIYKPELAARAVMKAVRDGTREILVGRSVLQLVLGNMVLPGWLDRKLARAGAELQKSGHPEPGGRPDNIDGPVAGVAARAHGRFGDRAAAEGIVVDGDRLRIAVFLGAPLLALAVGLVLG